MASDPVILVPMRVTAYLNYGSHREDPWLDKNTRAQGPHSYLAPIPRVNLEGVRIDAATGPAHDIYNEICDHIPLNASADPYRKLPSREGIYLHWSLPTHYRTAATASSSANPTTSTDTTDKSVPQFPPVPDRYLVIRYIDMSTSLWRSYNPVQVIDVTQVPEPNDGIGSYSSGYSLVDFFVVESASLFTPDQLDDFDQDIENTSSPYIDIASDPNEAPVTYLGQSKLLSDWSVPPSGSRRADPLNIIRTGDPYFADFQLHNSSVFSMFDNLITKTPDGSFYRLAKGSVSYSVVGWHVDQSLDPMRASQAANVRDKLQMNRLVFNTTGLPIDMQNQILTAKNAASLCHGTFLRIPWNEKIEYPAEKLQQAFISNKSLSIGTNAIDALFGWIRSSNATSPSETTRRLMKLQTFVLDVNDDLDSQLQAEDLLASNNFAPSSASSRAHFEISDSSSSSTSQPMPTLQDNQSLRAWNQNLARLASVQRKIAYLRQQLFDLWWLYVAEAQPRSAELNLSSWINQIKTLVGTKKQQIADLEALHARLQAHPPPAPSFPMRTSIETPYFTQRDPTMLIAGVGSGWSPEEAKPLAVRVDGQDIPSTLAQSTSPSQWAWSSVPPSYPISSLVNKIATKNLAAEPLINPIIRLVAEGALNAASSTTSTVVPAESFSGSNQFKGSNGWHPLFIEWQAEYYHIPWEAWEFKPCGPESRYNFAIRDDVDLAASAFKVLSGRSPIVPQTGATLKSLLTQVMSKMTPDEAEAAVPLAERDELLNQTDALDYLSTNMNGFFDQIVARQSGTHVMPIHLGNSTDASSNEKGQATVPPSVLLSAQAIGLSESDLKTLSATAGTTPSIGNQDSPSDALLAMFQPCTHGQFRFTKLNIVDRWGQVVTGIQQTTNLQDENIDVLNQQSYTELFPCLGEMYSVQSTTDSKAKTVLQRKDNANTFVQIPPCINQAARINACFVTEDSDLNAAGWRSLESHENPVRGYIVVDYANDSFQLFNSDGSFLCEYLVRSQGPKTEIASRPFSQNSALLQKADPLLRNFMSQLSISTFTRDLFHDITQSVETVECQPGHYAESMLSLMGRPLALVAFGTSLELSHPPVEPPSSTQLASSSGQNRSVTDYEFPIKIGDRNNIFDGLYGVFKPKGKGEIDFSTFYSYADTDPTQQPELVHLKPFFPDPADDAYAARRDGQLSIFGALVDPFTHVHFYSALLPIKQLEIPHWAISSGLSRVTAFFKTGPILSTLDLPAFDAAKVVDSGTLHANDTTSPPAPSSGDAATSSAKIQLPASGLDQWTWLQPYYDYEGAEGTRYNALDLEGVPKGPVWTEGPYTVTEGYLAMKRPFSGQT